MKEQWFPKHFHLILLFLLFCWCKDHWNHLPVDLNAIIRENSTTSSKQTLKLQCQIQNIVYLLNQDTINVITATIYPSMLSLLMTDTRFIFHIPTTVGPTGVLILTIKQWRVKGWNFHCGLMIQYVCLDILPYVFCSVLFKPFRTVQKHIKKFAISSSVQKVLVIEAGALLELMSLEVAGYKIT